MAVQTAWRGPRVLEPTTHVHDPAESVEVAQNRQHQSDINSVTADNRALRVISKYGRFMIIGNGLIQLFYRGSGWSGCVSSMNTRRCSGTTLPRSRPNTARRAKVCALHGRVDD